MRHDRTHGDERGTDGTRGRRTRWKAGRPPGRAAQGSGAARVVAGVTTGQGAWESRAQGEGQQGSGVLGQGGTRNAERRNCPSTHLREQAVTLESRMPGNWHVRFGGGPTEKAPQGDLAGGLSYWKPVYNLLEGQVAILVANAAHIKAVPGRKTDLKVAEWIADLLQHGLLQARCLPDRPQRELRDLDRKSVV